jgi:hypothetical protein
MDVSLAAVSKCCWRVRFVGFHIKVKLFVNIFIVKIVDRCSCCNEDPTCLIVSCFDPCSLFCCAIGGVAHADGHTMAET